MAADPPRRAHQPTAPDADRFASLVDRLSALRECVAMYPGSNVTLLRVAGWRKLEGTAEPWTRV